MNKPEQSEKDFQSNVVQLAEPCGWLVYHTFNSRRSQRGFPDLVMVHARRRLLVVAELKVNTPLSAEQYFWLMTFLMITPHVYLWHPEDMVFIEKLLREGI